MRNINLNLISVLYHFNSTFLWSSISFFIFYFFLFSFNNHHNIKGKSCHLDMHANPMWTENWKIILSMYRLTIQWDRNKYVGVSLGIRCHGIWTTRILSGWVVACWNILWESRKRMFSLRGRKCANSVFLCPLGRLSACLRFSGQRKVVYQKFSKWRNRINSNTTCRYREGIFLLGKVKYLI